MIKMLRSLKKALTGVSEKEQSKKIIKKLAKRKYETGRQFFQALTGDEKYFIAELVFVRANLIASPAITNRTDVVTNHLQSLVEFWVFAMGHSLRSLESAIKITDESRGTIRLVIAEDLFQHGIQMIPDMAAYSQMSDMEQINLLMKQYYEMEWETLCEVDVS